MRIILNTFGSFGDIHPYMAIAMELQRRGHAPVIATMEIYREKIEGAGLEFAPVRPNIPQPKEQDPELIEKIMEPKTGPRFLTEGLMFPAVRDSYEDLTEGSRRRRSARYSSSGACWSIGWSQDRHALDLNRAGAVFLHFRLRPTRSAVLAVDQKAERAWSGCHGVFTEPFEEHLQGKGRYGVS